MAFSSMVQHGVTLTRENFTRPPLEMGIMPFWFWNGRMDRQEMEWQLREYHAKGIRSIFIHGRFGLKVPYVSDAWFDKVKEAVDLARSIGIDAWVYDEMNWPSGTAERKVPTKYPHLTQKYLELVALNVDGPLFTFLEATDNRYVNTGDSWPVAAIGCTEEEYQTTIKSPIDLTLNLSFEKVLPWEAPAGKWRLLYFLQKEVPYYIDTLNPESTERFIELTHDRYNQAVGKEFGTTVPGFYTDEPAMHYYHVGIDNYVIPWTTQMFKIFREKRGYDLRPFLPALYLNMGPRTAQIRYDFWRTLTEQYAETYYGRIRSWCDEHGVLFTGHLLFEEWLRMHARCEGNLFRYLEKMHIVGVDHLYPKIGTVQEPDQHVALKVASSAAHHFGSTRLLCESMGGAYWDCSLERMKWIANWEYVLGVNLFNNHGYHYSIEGERKRDWPPSQFYHHTWWKHYDRFTNYMARISHALSGGRHVAKVLILYPLNSIWTNYVPQARTAVGNLIESDFCYLTDTLLRLHFDFDYVDEDVLAGAKVGGGKIGIRDEDYEVFILPPVTHVKESTFLLLKRFVHGGGTVIADTLLPVEFLEAKADGAVGQIQKMFGVDPVKALKAVESGKDAPLRIIRKAGKGSVTTFAGPGLSKTRPSETLRKALEASITPDVTISDGDVFYLHRVKDGFDIYFLANTSKEWKRGVEVSLEASGNPEVWDANTGAVAPLTTYSVRRGRTTFTLDFPPSESHIVVLTSGKPKPHVTETNLTVERVDAEGVAGCGGGSAKRVFANVRRGGKNTLVTARAKPALRPIALKGPWSFALEGDNALLLSSWKMAVGAGVGRPVEPSFDDSQWLSVKPGAWEMQLPQERDQATYPEVVWYRSYVEADVVPGDARMLIDGFSGSDHDVFINGAELNAPTRRSSLDAEIREVDIASYLHPGRNTIAIRLTVTRRTDGLLDPLKIVGRFTLERQNGSYKIIAPQTSILTGDWTLQGYPSFSGTGVYGASFRLPAQYEGGRIFLEADCGEDVLEVVVNGVSAGVQPWHPYRVDVTGHVRPGVNRLELKVTNSLINLLEGVTAESGLRSSVRLVHEHRYLLTPNSRKSKAHGTGRRSRRR